MILITTPLKSESINQSLSERLNQQISPTGRVDGRCELPVFLGGDVFPVGSPESQPLPTPLDVKVAVSRPEREENVRSMRDREDNYIDMAGGDPAV